MKKTLGFMLSVFMMLMALSFTTNVQADEHIIDLYPYDQEACLNDPSACTGTFVGDSHWDVVYSGHRYNVIRNLVRYGHEMVDDNSDGWIDDSELAGIPYNAFASIFMNNTASQIDILTANSRTDITDVVHRIYAHFDEAGVLQMVEDHYHQYYIHMDGDATTPDWRMATQAEIDAYDTLVDDGDIDSGDTSAAGTRYTPIRIALDDTDTDGHVVEPLPWLGWTNADVDTTTAPESDWSTIIDGDPNNLYIPAGWTVMSFGTNDRGSANSKTTDFVKSLAGTMLDDTVEPMDMVYDDQPATFSGILALDDDPETPGVNIVVDYNSDFTLPTDIEATWIDMIDETDGSVINETEHLDYKLDIYQDGDLLETIDYTWNETTEEYDASGEQTMIDTSVFGAGYTGVYSAVTPEDDTTEEEVDIVIGVMPPKFMGVEDRYINENTAIELLEGFTAEDGYEVDYTDEIVVDYPDNLNPYDPEPGVYDIDLEFTVPIFIEGVEPKLVFTADGTEYVYNWDTETMLNPDADITDCTDDFCVWTDLTNFRDAATGWSSMMVLVGADGNVDAIYNRYNWDLVTESGVENDGGANLADWQANVTLEDGGYMIGAHGTSSAGYQLRNLDYDDPVELSYEDVPDFEYDIVKETTYTLTVDDITAPRALVVNDNYTIMTDDYDDVEEAVLANVVVYDNHDDVEDIVVYVSDNGGLLLDTAGTYTVEVTATDYAGNEAVVEFDVEVVEPTPILTAAEIQTMIDESILTEADVQDLIDAGLADANILSEVDVQDMIDEAAPDTGCGSSGMISITGIIGIVLLLGTPFVIFRKH